MFRSFHFCCPQGHEWEVESAKSFEADPASSFCPICSAQGQSLMPCGSGAPGDLEDELPPPPPRPVGGGADEPTGTLRSIRHGRGQISIDPPSVAGYEILGELGRGGMGVVYHAKQANLNREVALKIILAGAYAGREERARFHLEAEAVARLKHPNVVQIHEVGEQDGFPYLALEFVEGGSLAQALAVRPMSSDQAARLVETLARAVHEVHRRGVIHRDLKPANVLLTLEGTPKITDFGLAKRLDVESGETKSGMVLGTPDYMAPEQARGEAASVGPAVDTYALGSILYEMLTGRPPFHAATTQETVQQLLNEEAVRPSRLQPKVPPDLETICLKCLQKDPGRRYASAGALAEDLRRFLAGESILARPTPTWERAAKWARRRPAAAALIAVSLAAGVALAAILLADNARLQRQRAIADFERDAAKMAQQRSEADFRLALDAVKRFYTEVSENRLLSVPTLDPLRIELLQRARDFYERIARERPHDPDVHAELARAGWRLAVMVSNSRSVPEGIGLLAKSIDIQERLAQQYPDRPEYRGDLARSYNNLGIMHRLINQRDLGAEDWKHALALREQLVREHPDDFLSRRDLAQSLQNLGNWYREQGGHLEQAEEAYQRALAIQNSLAREAPDAARLRTDLPFTPFALDPARIRYDLAFTYYNLGVLYRDGGQSAKAADALQHALDHLNRLVREQPGRAGYRHLLAKTHYDLGRLHQSDRQITRAAAAWLRSRELLQVLVREHPDDSNYQYNLALTLRSLSIAADATAQPAEAGATRLSAREIEERLIREHPEMRAYYYEAAGVYTSCSATVVPSGTGSMDRTAFAEACTALALDMLVEAEKAGYFRSSEGVKLLKTDEGLAPLRSRDGFRQLLARVLAASAPGSK